MKIHTVWGASGSGKTTVTVRLAEMLAKKGLLVGVIASNLEYTELPLLFKQVIHSKHGIYMAIKDKKASDHFWKCPVNENIFILTVPTGYNGYDGENVSLQDAKDLLEQSAAYFDIVLVDGHDSMSNAISSVSLTLSQMVVLLHKPSLKAAAWYESRETSIKYLKLAPRMIHVQNCYDNGIDPGAYWKQIECKPQADIPFIHDAAQPFHSATGRAGTKLENELLRLYKQMEQGKEGNDV